MQEESINEFDIIDEIVQAKDMDRLYKLQDNAVFSIGLHQILDGLNDKKIQLNEPQLNLFLCMHLENSGQSSGILSCLQDWYPQYLNKFVSALKSIEANQSAMAIEKAIALLPADGTWFYKTASEESELQFEKLDSQFSNYPDGSVRDLYRKYAETHKAAICNLEANDA